MPRRGAKRAHPEAEQGRALIRWRDLYARHVDPRVAWLYHTPNGLPLPNRTAMLAVAEGLTAGVWDYHWPVPIGGRPGLWIELKAPSCASDKDGGLSESQQAFGRFLQQFSAPLVVCYSWIQARDSLLAYAAGDVDLDGSGVREIKAKTLAALAYQPAKRACNRAAPGHEKTATRHNGLTRP